MYIYDLRIVADKLEIDHHDKQKTQLKILIKNKLKEKFITFAELEQKFNKM